MDREQLIHDWMVQTLKGRLSRDYREIRDNISGKREDFKGLYPDLILANHGIVLGVVEVETEGTINEEAARRWKALVDTGVKVILMVPKRAVKDVTALLWEKGIGGKVSIGTYEISITLP